MAEGGPAEHVHATLTGAGAVQAMDAKPLRHYRFGAMDRAWVRGLPDPHPPPFPARV